ncbi:hypothetical protein K9M74_00825 [Candidatus Woesearchaeota archaeon]|nr:hypothetical protein [Candidatus Woesearchaeota archaeon]
MAQLTAKQERGYRFEMLVLEAFKGISGIYNLMHNVEYHKERWVYRQADISYQIATPQGLELVLVEAKSSQGGPITRKLRAEVTKNGQLNPHITTLDQEILERQAFVGAQQSIAITNTYFNKEFVRAALDQGIYVIDHKWLESIFASQGKSYGSVERAINSIHLNGQVSQKNIIYIP